MNKTWSYKWASIILITMISTFFFVQITNAAVPEGHDFTSIPVGADYAPGELLVRFAPKAKGIQRSTAEKNLILSSLGGGTIERNYTIVPGLSLVKLPTGLTVKDALKTFNKTDGILYAEPNYRVKAFSAIFPNDPYGPKAAPDGGKQWHLNNIGQDPPGGSDDADIDAPEGWDISTGNSEIIVAVIDTGVDYSHNDLAANMWVNEAELNGTPGVDDDGNGRVDDIYGYDFCNYDADPIDDEGHGTACAGIVGAVGNNGVGVTGVCWNVKIMAVKFLDENGSGLTNDAISSIEYANLMGARVMSNSWGGGAYSRTLEDAIKAAKANGVLFIAASGNSGGSVSYPAKYAEAIAVGATDEDDIIWDYSSHGDELNVVAPSGETNLQGNIWTTDITGAAGYNNRDPSILDYTDKMGGTSAAAPQVAGLAALILSRNPCLSSDEVQTVIESNADDKGDVGWDEYYGWGRINVYNALDAVGPSPPCAYDDSILTEVDTAVEIALKALDDGLPDPPGALTYTVTSLPSQGTLSDPGAGAISSVPYTLANNGNQVVYTPGAGYKGPDSFTFKANDGGSPPNGGDSDEATISIQVFGIVHWWKLDEESGTTAVDSAGTKNGTLNNFPGDDSQWVDGKRDGGLDFDGDNDYVGFGTLEALKGQTLTISAWIKPDNAAASYSPIVRQYDLVEGNYFGYDLCLGSGRPLFYLDDTSAEAGDQIDNEWHHLAGTYDSQELRIYVDGVLKDTESYAGESGRDTDAAYIGYGIGSQQNWYFEGIIDDVRVYNWGVDVDEILDKMYYGTSKFSIVDDSGVRMAWFDNLGNLVLKGTLATGVDPLEEDPDHDEFRVQDSAGNDVAIIDGTDGNMYITGELYEQQDMTQLSPEGFIIKNSGGDEVAYIDVSGDLYLKGKLYQQNP